MGRWTQYDDDAHHLPEGMTRIGYDADTQRYTFQRGNEIWVGEPGSMYGGHLTRAGTLPDDDDGLERGPSPSGRSDGYQPLLTEGGTPPMHSNHNAYRMFMPFVLLILVFLLFVWRFIVGHSAPIPRSQERMCLGGPHAAKHNVKVGDTCWGIAQFYNTSVYFLLNDTLNPGLECEHLKPGDVVCLPDNI